MQRFDYVIFQEDMEMPRVGIDVNDADDIDSDLDTDFRTRLWKAQIYHGVLITRGITRVYEDLFMGDGPKTYKGRETNTRNVLKVVAKSEEDLVRPDLYHPLVAKWLRFLVMDWSLAIPPKETEVFGGLIPAVAEGRLESEFTAEEVAR